MLSSVSSSINFLQFSTQDAGQIGSLASHSTLVNCGEFLESLQSHALWQIFDHSQHPVVKGTFDLIRGLEVLPVEQKDKHTKIRFEAYMEYDKYCCTKADRPTIKHPTQLTWTAYWTLMDNSAIEAVVRRRCPCDFWGWECCGGGCSYWLGC